MSFFIDKAYCQLDSYDLTSYLQPDLRRLVVGTQFRLNGYGQYLPTGFASPDQLELFVSGNVDYQLTKIDRSKQLSIEHNLDLWLTDDLELDNDLYYSLTQSSNIELRKYKDKKKFNLIEPSWTIRYSEDRSSSFFADNYLMFFKTSLRKGIGRLENVTDAWSAIEILKSLRQNELLKSELNHTQISEFGQFIAEIKNARVLDFRNKDIYELSNIAQYIQDNGWSDESVKFFATLYDTWRYEAFAQRQSGRTFSLGVRPQVYVDPDPFGAEALNYFFEAVVENRKPISQNWQFDQTLLVAIGSGTYSDGILRVDLIRRIRNTVATEVYADVSLSNYLNARTYFEMTLSLDRYRDLDNKNFDLTTAFETRFARWFSPFLNLDSRIRISYQNSQNVPTFNNRYIRTNFWLTLNYFWR